MPELPFEKVPFVFDGREYDAQKVALLFDGTFTYDDMRMLKSNISFTRLPESFSALAGIHQKGEANIYFKSSEVAMPDNVKEAHAKMADEVRFWWRPSTKRQRLEAFYTLLEECLGASMENLQEEVLERTKVFVLEAMTLIDRENHRRHTEEARIRNFERAQLTRRLLGKRASRGIAPHRRRFAI